MKKLMIVAAAVAVAGIAEAVPGAPQMYQATYTLKTTVGKSAVATYNLGKNKTTGVFYYMDGSLGTWLDNTKNPDEMIRDTYAAKESFTYKTIKGATVPVPLDSALTNKVLKAALKNLSKTFNQRSAGVYCYTFSEDDCYRIAGTIKVTGWFVDDECLTGTFAGADIVDAFGAVTLDKSTKVEAYGANVSATIPLLSKTADAAWNGGPTVDVRDNLKADRTINALAIAGHGTRGKVYDPIEEKAVEPGVTALSGNAVGTATQGECESCCAPNAPATTFDCCGYGAANDTAVFGTFTIKYNLSQTKKVIY